MHLELNAGPPTILPITGAGNTEAANDHHLSVLLLELFCTCSEDDSHVLPTLPDLANRRTPTLIARVANPRVSCSAKLDTAAAKTDTNGHNRYSSVTICTELPMFNASMIVGAKIAPEAHVAPTPTHNGVIALTLSALASKASASAAH